MRITGLESNDAIAREIGARIKQVRIAYPLTQGELAERAGISLKTVSNLETGRDVRLGSLLSTMRALGMLANADVLVPERLPSPSDYIELGHDRQRATSPCNRHAPSGRWKWGDEQ